MSQQTRAGCYGVFAAVLFQALARMNSWPGTLSDGQSSQKNTEESAHLARKTTQTMTRG